MEFISSNLYETTTSIVVNSATLTAENIISPNPRLQYVSDGFNNDLTTTVITIQFTETTTVDRIAILGHNAKEFNVYYNGVTANAFALSGPTTTSQFTSNSASSLYLSATPVSVTSVTFDIKKTMVANSEKAVGHIHLGEHVFTFPRIPAAGGYTPVLKPKELIHELSTGGTRRHVVDKKWDVKIKLTNIEQSFRDDLKTLWDLDDALVFVPFHTTTSWDAVMFEANWVGSFEFYKFSDSAVSAGYTGTISLKET